MVEEVLPGYFRADMAAPAADAAAFGALARSHFPGVAAALEGLGVDVAAPAARRGGVGGWGEGVRGFLGPFPPTLPGGGV